MKLVSAEDYNEAQDSYTGFCVTCQDFTTGTCEPDARAYTCEVCEEPKVYGAEEALLMGLIDVEE